MDDETTTGSGEPAPVPYHRFKEVNDALKASKARLAELEASAGEVDTLRRKLEESKDANKAQIASLGTHLAMADAGLTDPLGREVAQLVYSRQPEEGRPALVDWLRGLRAEGADVPAPLRPYLSASTATDAQASPRATGTTGKPPPAAGNVTAQAIAEAEATFRRTGDHAAYTARLKELRVIT
jgi:hypothetical protein